MRYLLLSAAAIFTANLSLAQWEPDVRLTNDTAGSLTTYNSAWCVATNGDTMHTVWYDKRDGNPVIYYKRSTDAGLTWGSDMPISNGPGYSTYPSVAVSGSTVHVAWNDDRDGNNLEIYYKRSEDGGSTWGPDTRLTNALGNSWLPSMAASGSNVNIVWYDYRDGKWEIYYKRSTDSGVSWEPDARLTISAGNPYPASVSASGAVLHVAWRDDRDGNSEIYYKRSTDGGLSWGTDTRLTDDPAYSGRPSISASGSIVHVVWHDDRDGNWEIYTKHSTDGGITWGDDMRLTTALNDSKYPNISLSGPVVHVVWQDTRDGDLEVYYKRSEDEGLTWAADIRLTNSSGDSENPGVAVSGPVVHVVWFDQRDGNDEIYYKRDSTGGFAVGTGNDKTPDTSQQITIYPNPASNFIHIIPDKHSIQPGILSIRNFSGAELFSSPVEHGESVIDVSGLQTGIYLVEITTGDRPTVSKKLVIQK